LARADQASTSEGSPCSIAPRRSVGSHIRTGRLWQHQCEHPLQACIRDSGTHLVCVPGSQRRGKSGPGRASLELARASLELATRGCSFHRETTLSGIEVSLDSNDEVQRMCDDLAGKDLVPVGEDGALSSSIRWTRPDAWAVHWPGGRRVATAAAQPESSYWNSLARMTGRTTGRMTGWRGRTRTRRSDGRRGRTRTRRSGGSCLGMGGGNNRLVPQGLPCPGIHWLV
jgi:hypothetical protein